MKAIPRGLGAQPRRFLVAGLAACALIGSMVLRTSPARAAEVQMVADLGLSYLDTIVTDDRTHRIIAIGGEATGPLTLKVFDGDSLKQVDQRSFAQWWNQGTVRAQPTTFAFDESARTLRLVAYHTLAERLVTVNPVLVTINVDTFVAQEVSLAAAVPPGFVVQGLRIEGDAVYLLEQVAPPQQATRVPVAVLMVEADLGSGSQRNVFPVRGCQEVVSNWHQSVVARDGTEFLVSCATASVRGLVSAPGVPAIIAVPLADPTDVRRYYLPGGYSQGDVYYDSGARRLLVVGSTPGHPNQSAWVFDVRRRLFLGQVAAGDRALFSAGVNPRTGRLYVGSQISLLISSARGLQIPQAFEFEGFESNAGTITPLPWNRYIIVPVTPGRLVVFSDEVSDDEIVPGAPVDYSSFDHITTDVPQFAGDVQAFGWRLRQIAGISGIRQNVLPPVTEGFWGLAEDQFSELTGIRDGNNVFTFARVTAAHLSDADASAKAVSVDIDDTTDSNAEVLGQQLSTDEAGCVDFGGGRTEQEEDGVLVECDKEKGNVTATVAYPGLSAPGVPVTIGRASATTTLQRDPKRGLVITAHAEARDVEIGADVEIGYVASDVSVGAFGKPGTARATYTSSFRNVRAGSFECTEDCPVWDVLNNVSSTLGTQFIVQFPAADLHHTKGGTHAHASRDVWEHQQDVVLNGEGDQELQVPALRIVYINDNSSASRTVLDFAATKADATWFRLGPPQDFPGFTQVPPEIVPPVPPIDVFVPGDPGSGDTGTGGAITRVLKVLGHGWKFLFTGRSGVAIRSVALWILFVTPFFLAARRRHLMRLAARDRS